MFLNKYFFIILLVFLPCISLATVQTRFPKIWNLYSPNANFVGRNKELALLHKNLHEKNYNIYAIVGNGGIGKTQLVKQYAEKYKSDYDIVWWFSSTQDITKQFKELALQLTKSHIANINKEDFQITDKELLIHNIKEFFRTTNHKWFLVFDNYDVQRDIQQYLPVTHNPKSLGHIIITSRNSLGWDKAIKLDKLTRSQSLSLLKRFLSHDNTLLNQLANILDDYPLALLQAASYIRSVPSVDINEYITLFNESHGNLWREQEKMTDNFKNISGSDLYEETMFKTLGLTLEKIKKSNYLAYELINSISYLHSGKIPEFLLKSLAKYSSGQNNDKELDAAISEMINHSLLEKDEKNTYNMSKINQTIIRNHNVGEAKEYLNVCIKALLDHLSPDVNESAEFFYEHDYLTKHMERVIELADYYKLNASSLIDLKLRLAEYYLVLAVDYKSAESMIENLKKNPHMTSLQQYYFNILTALFEAWHNLNYAKSIELALIAEKNLLDYPDKIYERLWLYNQLAQFYLYRGNVRESLNYIGKSADIVERNSGISGKSLYEWIYAKISMNKGDFIKALDLYEQYDKTLDAEIDIKDEHEVPVPWMVEGTLLENRILLKLGRASEIYDRLKSLASKLDSIFGTKDHNSKYYTHAILADTATNLGELSVAQDSINKAEEMLKRMVSEDAGAQEQGYLYLTKGNLLSAQNQYKDAFDAYILAEHIYNKIFSVKETDDVSENYSKLALTAVKLNNEKAAQYYLDLHRKYFGTNHVRTSLIIECMIENKMKVDL